MDYNKWEDFATMLNLLMDFNRLNKKDKDMILDLMSTMNNYNQLIMAVESKYEGETRHETALRYIKSYEQNKCLCAKETA